MRWGLIPYWAKDPTIGLRTINAKAETIRTTPIFREAIKYRPRLGSRSQGSPSMEVTTSPHARRLSAAKVFGSLFPEWLDHAKAAKRCLERRSR